MSPPVRRLPLLNVPLLSLPLLLAACGQSSPVPGGTGSDDIPTVARPTRPSRATCVLGAASTPDTAQAETPAWLQRLGGPGNLRGVNVRPPRMTAQATATLFDQLYDIRLLINGEYWGTSTVELQALHERYENLFRTTFGNLKAAVPNRATDAMTNDYIDAIGDGHTYFLNPTSYQAFLDSMQGNPTPTPRFGFSYAPVPGENGAVLLDVTPGSPAALAGLGRGDTLLSVNGTPLTRQADDDSTQTLYHTILSNAAQRGTAQTGKSVTLSIRRGETLLTVTVTPQIIDSSEPPSGRFLSKSTYLLRLPTFEGRNVAQQTHDLIRRAQAGGASNLILDLRDNGGGLLAQAVAMAGAFVPGRAGETIEVLDGSDETYAYRNGQVLAGYNCKPSQNLLTVTSPATWTGRTLILLNRSSASASEIVSQQLLSGGAQLFGETTYGVSNTVTTIESLPAGRGMAVTIGRGRDLAGNYFTPSVTPAHAVTDDLRVLAHGTDTVLQAALSTLP